MNATSSGLNGWPRSAWGFRRHDNLKAERLREAAPGIGGLTVIRQAQRSRPGLPAVLLTGYVGDGAQLAVSGALSGAFSLLRKPVSAAQLADRIEALLVVAPTP